MQNGLLIILKARARRAGKKKSFFLFQHCRWEQNNAADLFAPGGFRVLQHEKSTVAIIFAASCTAAVCQNYMGTRCELPQMHQRQPESHIRVSVAKTFTDMLTF